MNFKRPEIWLPVLMLLVFGGYVVSKMRPANDAPGTMAIHAFGKLPIVHNGRVKPFDALARESLMTITDRQDFYDAAGKKQPAIRWLLDVMSEMGEPSTASMQHRVYRIENLDLLEALQLQPRQEPAHHKYRYAIEEFRDRIPLIAEQATRYHQKQQKNEPLELYERKVLELANQIQLQLNLSQLKLPLCVAPESPEGEWASLRDALPTGRGRDIGQILIAYRESDVAKFNQAIETYRTSLQPQFNSELKKTSLEAYFHQASPFYYGIFPCVAAFCCSCLAWLGWRKPLNRSAFALMALALIVFSISLVVRMIISGRPPVTTLYSSAVFIGWGCILIGLVLESFTRLGIGTLVASIAGFIAMFIAHHLATIEGDTFRVMQAVLDTNFWLATHVVCITFGYATTYFAGLLAVLYLLLGVFTRELNTHVAKELTRMTYGIICFALLFSFVGTVLGGLWADDSWGRFWGWDPKENGALIIVLWNALVLHARWGGMVRQRGLAILAVFGNIVTSWSWFGVNELGVGLHSYGFTEGTRLWLMIFIFSQLAVMTVGALPSRFWTSMDENGRLRDKSPSEPKTKPAPTA